MPQGHVPGTPDGRVWLASMCTGVGVGCGVRAHPQPLGQGKAEKPMAVLLELVLSQAVGPFPLSVCICAGARLSCRGNQTCLRDQCPHSAWHTLSSGHNGCSAQGPCGKQALLAVSICSFLTLAFLEVFSFREKDICHQAETHGVENSSVSSALSRKRLHPCKQHLATKGRPPGAVLTLGTSLERPD